MPRVAPPLRYGLPTGARTFEGDPVGREDHLLGDGFGSGVVVDVLEQTAEATLQRRFGACQKETTAFWEYSLCRGARTTQRTHHTP